MTSVDHYALMLWIAVLIAVIIVGFWRAELSPRRHAGERDGYDLAIGAILMLMITVMIVAVFS